MITNITTSHKESQHLNFLYSGHDQAGKRKKENKIRAHCSLLFLTL